MKRQRRQVGSRRNRRQVGSRRSANRGGSWYRIKDNLGISGWAKFFIEKQVNKLDVSGLRRFNINRSTWFTRKRLGQCAARLGRKVKTEVRVDIPRSVGNGYYMHHQGKGKRGMTVKSKDEAVVFVAMHELRHVAQFTGQVKVKRDHYHMEDDADDFGFEKLKEFRGKK